MSAESASRDTLPLSSAAADGAVFDVRPCRSDPLCRLLKDRWNVSPLAAAILLISVTALNILFDVALGRPLSRVTDLADPEARLAAALYFILFPSTAYIAFRFYRQAETLFERLYRDGVISAPLDAYNRYLARLDRRYNSPLVAVATLEVVALLLGSGIAGAWHEEYAGRGIVTPLRILSDVSLALVNFAILIPFLIRAVLTAFALRRVLHWPVVIQPTHPDGCGGLGTVTAISVTMAVFLTIASSMNAMFALSESSEPSGPNFGMMVGFAMAVSPLIFLGVIYEAHRAMRRSREALLQQVDALARPHYQRLREGLAEGRLAPQEADDLARLDQVRALIHRFPTWPVNTEAAAQITLSVAVPLALVLLQIVLERIAGR